MADSDKLELSLDDSYQNTRAYRDADPTKRRQLNRYKKENDISDEHMLLLLFKSDLDNVPKEVREKADFSSKAMLVIGVLLMFNAMQSVVYGSGSNKFFTIMIALVSFCLVLAVYFTGALNNYRRLDRLVNKHLKGMPEVPDFEEWNRANPAPQEKSTTASRSRGRGSRRRKR